MTHHMFSILQLQYCYIILFLENPNERVKYNTQDIKSAIISVQKWLVAIRKLLYPNEQKKSDNNNCKDGKLNYLF